MWSYRSPWETWEEYNLRYMHNKLWLGATLTIATRQPLPRRDSRMPALLHDALTADSMPRSFHPAMPPRRGSAPGSGLTR